MTFGGVGPLIRDRECGALLADKAFDADRLVKDLTERGSKVVIPPRSNRKTAREYDKEMYKWRHLVENFFCKLNSRKGSGLKSMLLGNSESSAGLADSFNHENKAENPPCFLSVLLANPLGIH